MALNYITTAASFIVFIFYIMIIILAISIKKRIDRKAGKSFNYIILAIFALAIRRLQQIFNESDILHPIPYFPEIVTIIFAFLFFMAVFSFYRAIKEVDKGTIKNRKR